ncbi:uncharacterized protein TNCV_4640671 [Trichonephila clavipes]|nr:uncharacterized protein TNCV_4640671 [Trichonephila clavipes]
MSNYEIRYECSHSLMLPRKSEEEPSNIAAGSESDVPFVISCTNEEGDEDIVETCHVSIGLKKSDPSRYEPRKRFGSFACGPRKFSNTFSTIAHSRTRKSLPLNIKSNEQSEAADFRQHLKAAYQRTFNKMSRHNSVVPQYFNVVVLINSLTTDVSRNPLMSRILAMFRSVITDLGRLVRSSPSTFTFPPKTAYGIQRHVCETKFHLHKPRLFSSGVRLRCGVLVKSANLAGMKKSELVRIDFAVIAHLQQHHFFRFSYATSNIETKHA